MHLWCRCYWYWYCHCYWYCRCYRFEGKQGKAFWECSLSPADLTIASSTIVLTVAEPPLTSFKLCNILLPFPSLPLICILTENMLILPTFDRWQSQLESARSHITKFRWKYKRGFLRIFLLGWFLSPRWSHKILDFLPKVTNNNQIRPGGQKRPVE